MRLGFCMLMAAVQQGYRSFQPHFGTLEVQRTGSSFTVKEVRDRYPDVVTLKNNKGRLVHSGLLPTVVDKFHRTRKFTEDDFHFVFSALLYEATSDDDD